MDKESGDGAEISSPAAAAPLTPRPTTVARPPSRRHDDDAGDFQPPVRRYSNAANNNNDNQAQVLPDSANMMTARPSQKKTRAPGGGPATQPGVVFCSDSCGAKQLDKTETKKLAKSRRPGSAAGLAPIATPPARAKHDDDRDAKAEAKSLELAPAIEPDIAPGGEGSLNRKQIPSSSDGKIKAQAGGKDEKKLRLAPGIEPDDTTPGLGRGRKQLALMPGTDSSLPYVFSEDHGRENDDDDMPPPPPAGLQAEVSTPGAVRVRGRYAIAHDEEDDDTLLYNEEGEPTSAPPPPTTTTTTPSMLAASGIPQAQIVTEDDDEDQRELILGEFGRAEPASEDDLVKGGLVSWVRQHKLLSAVALLVVVGAIVGGVVGSSAAGGGGGGVTPSEAPSSAPSAAPTITGFDLVDDILSQITPLPVLNDPTTPQHAAARWLLLQDGYNLDFDNEPKVVQRYVLATIYFATDGANWTRQLGFLSDADDCSWNEELDDLIFGVRSCDGDGLVDLLSLSRNGLRGTVPEEIGGLSNLIQFGVAINPLLTGTIPQTITSLSNLVEIFMFDSSLTGSIPDDIGNLEKLTHLAVQMNSLTGPIPSSIGELSNLVNFFAFENSLSGPLPSSIGNLVSLRLLDVNTTLLSGSIPSQVSQMTSLLEINLHFTSFTDGMENFCTGSIDFNTLYSDCLRVDFPGLPIVEAEVECSCCTFCCADHQGGSCLPNN